MFEKNKVIILATLVTFFSITLVPISYYQNQIYNKFIEYDSLIRDIYKLVPIIVLSVPRKKPHLIISFSVLFILELYDNIYTYPIIIWLLYSIPISIIIYYEQYILNSNFLLNFVIITSYIIAERLSLKLYMIYNNKHQLIIIEILLFLIFISTKIFFKQINKFDKNLTISANISLILIGLLMIITSNGYVIILICLLKYSTYQKIKPVATGMCVGYILTEINKLIQYDYIYNIDRDMTILLNKSLNMLCESDIIVANSNLLEMKRNIIEIYPIYSKINIDWKVLLIIILLLIFIGDGN